MTDDIWAADLDTAYTALLGAPLDTFGPADYGLYYRNQHIHHDLFAVIGSTTALGTGPDGSPPELVSRGLDATWRFDLARSEFEVEPDDETPLGTALTGGDTYALRRGDELAALLTASGHTTDDVAGAVRARSIHVAATLRIATDGTLLDALRTATRTGAGPDGLRPDQDERARLPFAAGVFTSTDDVEVPAVLAGIRDRRLRAHLTSPYLDAPWRKGAAPGPGPATRFGGPADRPGATCVAAWELAYYGEIALGIVRTWPRRDGSGPPGAGSRLTEEPADQEER